MVSMRSALRYTDASASSPSAASHRRLKAERSLTGSVGSIISLIRRSELATSNLPECTVINIGASLPSSSTSTATPASSTVAASAPSSTASATTLSTNVAAAPSSRVITDRTRSSSGSKPVRRSSGTHMANAAERPIQLRASSNSRNPVPASISSSASLSSVLRSNSPD